MARLRYTLETGHLKCWKIFDDLQKAPQGTRILRSKVYCVILHSKYAPTCRVRSPNEVCLPRHPERATQKKRENKMSEEIKLTLHENSWEFKLIEAMIEEITTQNIIADVLMWDDSTAKVAAMTLRTLIREAQKARNE